MAKMSHGHESIRLLSIIVQMGLPKAGVANPEAIPALVLAPPGVGKTEVINRLGMVMSKADGKIFPVETIAIPQATPEQIGGLPVPENGVTHLLPMSAGKKLLAAGRGIFFFDEITSGTEQVAASCLTLIQSGKFGDHILPPSVARIAAGNLPERATNGRPLTAPESNRFCFLSWPMDLDAWCDYMNGGDGLFSENNIVVLPDNWERDFYPRAASYVTTYMKRHTTALHREPALESATRAWPSPRSWRNATRLLAAVLSIGERETSQLAQKAIEGCVGENAAGDFFTWLTSQDLVDPEDVLAVGSTWSFKDSDASRNDRVLLTAQAIAHAACQKNFTDEERTRRWMRAAEVFDAYNKPIVVNSVSPIMSKEQPQGLKKIPAFFGTFQKTTRKINAREMELKLGKS